MLVVGITGGIGSGKSLVCRLFSLLGVPVYLSDEQARYLTDNDPQIRQQLISLFGPLSYMSNGLLDRKRLSEIVFQDSEALKRLNEIVHPVVREHFRLWVKQNNRASYVIQEAAILCESGLYRDMDQVITVTAPLDLRIERVMARDGVLREAVLARIENQMPQEQKEKRSQFVIVNDGVELLIPQVLKVHALLKQMAGE